MFSDPWFWSSACALLVAALVGSIWLGWKPGVWLFKPTASLAFMAAAYTAGALDTDYGWWILLGLALSLGGDVLLIPEGSGPAFLAGVLSFLLGHVAYVCAFVSLGLDVRIAGFAAVGAALAVAAVAPTLVRAAPPDLKVAVGAYIAVISTMIVTAFGASAHVGVPAVWVGAGLFYVSDLFVARERFMTPGFANQGVGLPLYYGGQIVLALSCIPL